jgi:hypothetical protein
MTKLVHGSIIGNCQRFFIPFFWILHRKIKKPLGELMKNPSGHASDRFKNILEECIKTIGSNDLYQNNTRLLKIWLLYVRPLILYLLVLLLFSGLGKSRSLVLKLF